MKKYYIYYDKYNIISNDYISMRKEVETEDIFHEVGLLIYKSLEDIKNIRFFEIKEKQNEK